MSKPTWVKIGPRSYEKRTASAMAFVFGASVPSSLWAWSVYWSSGHAAWVEGSFARARTKADECMADTRNLEQSPGLAPQPETRVEP